MRTYLVLRICNLFGIELTLNDFRISEEDIRILVTKLLRDKTFNINPKSLKEFNNNANFYKEKICKFLEEKKNSTDDLFKEFICKILDNLYNESFRYYIYEILIPYNVYSNNYIIDSKI